VLVIGIGPTLKIMNIIKTIAHLILAQLETVFIEIIPLAWFFLIPNVILLADSKINLNTPAKFLYIGTI